MKHSIAELAKYLKDKYDEARNCSMIRRVPVSSDYPQEKYDAYAIPKSSVKNDPVCINIRKDVHLPILSLHSRHVKLNKVVKGEVITAKELLPDDCNSYLFG